MGVLFKLYKSVDVLGMRLLLSRQVHNLTLSVWQGEDTIWHIPVVVGANVIIRNTLVFELQKIELIVAFLHHLPPVIIVVVAAMLQEASRDKLWLYSFLGVS